mmetsp:Transcript_28025/g.41330  ORF Transcript_28025/g.41330 Transcript_28025/m.41330 type:complete len:84 (+) Transcript_28025:372-623(+)
MVVGVLLGGELLDGGIFLVILSGALVFGVFFVAWWYDSLIWLDAIGLMDGGNVMVGYVDIYSDGGDENCIYTACDALYVGCCA